MYNLNVVLHVVEVYTGATLLDLGVVAGAVALGYFFPQARIFAGIVILNAFVAYGAFLYGEEDGRAQIRAEWTAANAKATDDAKKRDATAAGKSVAAAQQDAGLLQSASAKDQDQINALIARDKDCHPITADQLR